MSAGPPIAHGGTETPGFGRLLAPEEARMIERMANIPPGDILDLTGRPVLDKGQGLYRSPGMFAVRIVEGGEAVLVGEDWIGPSRVPGSESAEGSLEGCSARRPGVCSTMDGRVRFVGGATRVTAASISADVGGTGPAVLLALIEPFQSVGVATADVVYKAVAAPSAGITGQWFDLKSGLDAAYADYHAVPVALLEVASGPEITDVYWSLESASITLAESASGDHPWKLRVYGAPGALKFQVSAGYVHDGYEAFTVAAVAETAATDPLYVWARIKYYNSDATASEFEILHGGGPFPLSSGVLDSVPNPSNPAVVPSAGHYQTIVPLARYTSAGGIEQFASDILYVPRGRTYDINRMVGFRWNGTVLQTAISTERYILGRLVGCVVALHDIFDTGPCPEPEA